MKTIRKWIRFWFGFSRRETNGFLVILILMIITLFSRSAFRLLVPVSTSDYSVEGRYLDSLLAHSHAALPDSAVGVDSEVFRKFFFDPNIASAAELEALGIPPAIAGRIVKYRSKGGRFYQKEDLMKIYGFREETYDGLDEWIRIAGRKSTPTITPPRLGSLADRSIQPEVFDLNTADTTKLKALRGIGSVLADRIVRFRDKLGGFVDPHQLYEVYNLDSAVARSVMKVAVISDGFTPRKLNLNAATEPEFASHPYISRSVARMLVAYRFQHGPFTSVTEIRNIQALTDQIFAKLEPYLFVD